MTQIADILGSDDLKGIQLLSQDQNLSAYENGARGDKGCAAFVMRPKTLDEVSRCVSFCISNNIKFVPQSANTGLVGASIPDISGEQAVLTLEGLTSTFDLDVNNRSVTVSAGMRLSELNNRLFQHDLFLPIDLGSDPMIGGMVATNTGGSRYLRYGDMRRNVLGLKVVLPTQDGDIVSLGSSVRKNNTGQDWKQQHIGTSGEFGVITEVTLNLEPSIKQQAAAILVPSSDNAIFELLKFLETHLGPVFSAYELMSESAMRHALAHAPSLSNPFAGGKIPRVALLLELSRSSQINPWETPLDEVLEQVLAQAWELPSEPLEDALFGRPEQIWSFRHALSEGVKSAGTLFAFDLGFTRPKAIEFRNAMIKELPKEFPELEICDFGHIGDGGLHFNLVCKNSEYAKQPGYEQHLRDWVMEQAVVKYGGSFSAEHGIGPKNIRYYERYSATHSVLSVT